MEGGEREREGGENGINKKRNQREGEKESRRKRKAPFPQSTVPPRAAHTPHCVLQAPGVSGAGS